MIIDRGVDIKDAVGKIVAGAAFDNGIICSHEQFVLTPEERYDETVEAFDDTGKVWFTNDETRSQKLREVVFPGRAPEQGRRRQVGARHRRDGRHRRAGERAHHPAAGEGAGTSRRPREGEALPRRRNPGVQDLPRGRGARPRRTCSSKAPGTRRRCTRTTRSNIREAGVELPISRLVVNQASSLTAGGSLTNGFAPTTTLGCGSWGGNSISENLDYKHLMNVSRIGKVITDKRVPTDEEIFA